MKRKNKGKERRRRNRFKCRRRHPVWHKTTMMSLVVSVSVVFVEPWWWGWWWTVSKHLDVRTRMRRNCTLYTRQEPTPIWEFRGIFFRQATTGGWLQRAGTRPWDEGRRIFWRCETWWWVLGMMSFPRLCIWIPKSIFISLLGHKINNIIYKHVRKNEF